MHIVCGLRHTMPNRAQVAVEREELCRKSCKGCGYAVYRAVALELCLPMILRQGTRHMQTPCALKCDRVHCACTFGYDVFTSSGVGTAAAGLEAAVERLRSAESWEAAAEGLGRTEGLETAAAYELDLTAEGLGRTEGLETAAANELDSITAGEAVAAGSGAAVATAGSATSDAAAVLAATLDGATTSDAGSIAFEWIASASASASSFWMKRAPSASTALTGPVRPWSARCLALGWAHASAVVGCMCEARGGLG